jgi:hypothetical protein
LSQCRYQLSPRGCWHVFFLVINPIGIALISIALISFEGTAQAAGIEVSAPSKVSSIYQSNYDLRQHRKMGVGGSIGGPLGVLGIFTELNLRKQDSVVAGFGAGSGYNSFLMSWKRSFEGVYLSPYSQLGYSRWFSSGKSGEPSKSTILSQVLDESQKGDGKFGKDFIVGSLGLQYAQLQGETTGLSFFLQFDLMFAPENGLLLPTGALGSIYFF